MTRDILLTGMSFMVRFDDPDDKVEPYRIEGFYPHYVVLRHRVSGRITTFKREAFNELVHLGIVYQIMCDLDPVDRAATVAVCDERTRSLMFQTLRFYEIRWSIPHGVRPQLHEVRRFLQKNWPIACGRGLMWLPSALLFDHAIRLRNRLRSIQEFNKRQPPLAMSGRDAMAIDPDWTPASPRE